MTQISDRDFASFLVSRIPEFGRYKERAEIDLPSFVVMVLLDMTEDASHAYALSKLRGSDASSSQELLDRIFSTVEVALRDGSEGVRSALAIDFIQILPDRNSNLLERLGPVSLDILRDAIEETPGITTSRGYSTEAQQAIEAILRKRNISF